MLNRIKRVVELNPNKIAYKVKNNYITYKELWDSSNHYAELLKKQGSSPVIIYGHKSINVVISILACLLANRPYVPVGLCTPSYRLKKIITITKSSLVLTDSGISFANIDVCNLEGLEKYRECSKKIIHNDIAYMIFTSGSTGVPKGVPISKANLHNFIDWISKLKPLCSYKDVYVLNQASFSFDLSVADFYYSLCNGHTLVALDSDLQEDYNEIFELLSVIDVAVVTPTFIKLCLLNSEFNEKKYPKFKCVYFCGEQLEVKTVQKLYEVFPHLNIINAYGPTEATSAVSGILITRDMLKDFQLLPVGEVNNFATDIEIINDEIVLKGKSVFRGYLGNYLGGYYRENGLDCYKTGDIGYIQDGKLYCKGRKDSQIKYKGYRIELNDIEYHLNLIHGVRECVVVAKYNENFVVKMIKAFVVVDDDCHVDTIRKELEKYIPKYMVPKTIKKVDKLPINQNGKIDRKALNEL